MYQTIKIVPLIEANVIKCMCSKCPVQAKSACVSGKMKSMQSVLKDKPLKKENIPGVYCSSGIATCTDIDTTKSCFCGTCAVFSEYKLAGLSNIGYYCKKGSAQ